MEVDVCQEWVVWSEYIGSNWDIMAYNISIEELLPVYSGPGKQTYPRIDGDWILWNDSTNDDGDLIFGDFLARTIYPVFNTSGVITYGSMHLGDITFQYGTGTSAEVTIGGPLWAHDAQVLGGLNRFETAAAIAAAAYRVGSRDVVIATGRDFPDALGASALAGYRNVPILLTERDHLPPATAAALLSLGVNDDVYVVGGTAAISDTVLNEIKALLPSYDSVRRIWGSDRYATSLAIAKEITGGASGGLDEPYGFVATGRNYPDALAASSMAYGLDIPIYLCPGTSISTETLDAMAFDGVERVVIIGGETAVNASVQTALNTRFGASNVMRVWGSNRYETAAELASFAEGEFKFGASGLCVATGQNFPDALSGGVLAGARYAPILLADGTTLSPATAEFLDMHENEIRWVTFLGGDSALPDVTKAAIEARLK